MLRVFCVCSALAKATKLSDEGKGLQSQLQAQLDAAKDEAAKAVAEMKEAAKREKKVCAYIFSDLWPCGNYGVYVSYHKCSSWMLAHQIRVLPFHYHHVCLSLCLLPLALA